MFASMCACVLMCQSALVFVSYMVKIPLPFPRWIKENGIVEGKRSA